MKFAKRILSLALFLSILLSIATPVIAAEQDEVSVEKVLQQLDTGLATEVFEEHEFSDLRQDEIEADPILNKIISDIREKEYSFNPNSRINYDDTVYGTYYTDTITDATGATIKYYLAPRLFVEYGDVPQNGSVSWYSKLYVYEYVTLNGIEQDGYMNRIKLKNIKGAVGAGPNVRFSKNVYIKKETESAPGVAVNALGLISALLSLVNYQSASAVTSALANISYTSGTSGYTLNVSNKNLVGAKFDSGIAIDDKCDKLSIACTVGTASSATAEDATCYYSFRWNFDVYKGTSKYKNATIKKDGSVLGNAV